MIARRTFLFSAAASLLLVRGASAQTPSPPGPLSARRNLPIYYNNGALRLEAYYSRPEGAGPFPLVIFNHGSRAGNERREVNFAYMAELFTAAGYAVLVPERRGYGKSDGEGWTEAVGNDNGERMIARLRQESEDVLAILDALPMLPAVDAKRIALVGWSLGGIVTMFAIARSDAFRAAIDEAGGSLTWSRSPALQKALIEAANATKIPVLFLDAQNDATTASVTTLAAALKAKGVPQELKIYPAFTPKENPERIAPGHLIFGNEGVSIWGGDEIAFLAKYL